MFTSSAYRNARIAALTAAACLSLGFTLPAGAARVEQRADANEQSGGTSAARAATSNNPDREICVRAQLTGSRLNRRICRTQRQWDEDGGVPTGR
jgi:hypothetical protein